MPISSSDLEKRFIIAMPDETIGALLSRLPANRSERAFTCIVLPGAGGRYVVVRWSEVEQIAALVRQDIRGLRLATLPGLPQPVEAIEQNSVGNRAARDLRDAQPGRRLVVLSSGAVVGLLVAHRREGEETSSDLYSFPGEPERSFSFPGEPEPPAVLSGESEERAAGRPATANGGERGPEVEPDEAMPPEAAPPIDLDAPSGRGPGPDDAGAGGAAGGGGQPSPLPPPPPAEAPQPGTAAVDNRVINAWVDGQPADAPLVVGQTYDLKFNVDLPRADARATAGGIDGLTRALPADQQRIEVQVVIDTDDFEVYGDQQQTLIVPRVGRSKNTVTFSIEPKHNGASVIKALFFANNRMFQRKAITFQVGPTITSATAATGPGSIQPIEGAQPLPGPGAGVPMGESGMTLAGVMALPPRGEGIDLIIEKQGDEFKFILQSSGGRTHATIKLAKEQLSEMVGRARDVLKGIVYTKSNNQYVYQVANTTIPEAIHQESLKTLAKLGVYLYEQLFYATDDADARIMGNLLRQLSQQYKLSIRIISDNFIFPWALLYDRPLTPGVPDTEGFWGFKHILEYPPEFAVGTLVNLFPRITVSDKLALGFVFNTMIDEELHRKGLPPVIQPQREFLPTLPGVSISEHPNSTDLYNLLNNVDTPAQLLYFYCHAQSYTPGNWRDLVEALDRRERTGDPIHIDVADSLLKLSDGPVRLEDLITYAPRSNPPLKQAPLVFLNACQGAELSPYLYEGLVPYLISRGVRGVLGTEVDTPIMFAAEFAREFLKRFVAGGQPLGELLLEMRRMYLKKNNVLGLIYALYSSGEIVVQRAS